MVIDPIKGKEENLNHILNKYQKMSGEMSLILDNISALIFFKDLNNNFIFVNKYVADAHRMDKQDLIGKNMLDIYPKEQAEKYYRDDLAIIKTGKSINNIIERWRTADGEKWLSTNKIPIKDPDGKIVAILGLSIDITEKYLSEKNKKQMIENVNNLFDVMPVGIIIIEMNHKIYNINKEALSIFKISSKDEVINKDCSMIRDRIQFRCEFCPLNWNITNNKKIYKKEINCIVNGKKIHLLKSIVPVNLNGRKMLLESFIEITSLKETQNKLIESEEKFRNVLENSSHIIYQYNFIKKKYDYVSSSTLKLLGYSPEEITDMGLKGVSSLIHPEDYKKISKIFKEFMNLKNIEEVKSSVQFRLKHKRFGYKWLEDTRNIKFDHNSKPIAMIGNIVDISSKKRIEEYEKEFREKLELEVFQKTNELEKVMAQQKIYLDQLTLLMGYKENFFSSVSHEFKTPLNIILGFIDVLLGGYEGEINENQKKMLEDIRIAAVRLSNLIHDVIEISEMDSNTFRLNLEFVDASSIINLVDKCFRENKRSNNVILGIDWNSNEQLYVDIKKIKMVLDIIIEYILSKIDSGFLSFSLLKKEKSWSLVFGIDSKKMNHDEKEIIFLDFDVNKSLLYNNQQSSGLKLPIAKRLIELHGGYLTIVETENNRIEFRIDIYDYRIEDL